MGADEVKCEAALKAKRFGPRLRELRARLGLSQAALAKRAGMAQSKVAEYESPTRNYVPSWETVIRLSLVLEVDPTSFLREPEKKVEKIPNPD